MMITENKVRTVSDYVKELSDGKLGLKAVGADIVHGTRRYIDGRRQMVWCGRGAGRKAACYYLGMVDTLNSFNAGRIAELPDEVNAVRHDLECNGWFQSEYDQGAADAASFLRYQELSQNKDGGTHHEDIPGPGPERLPRG